MTSSSRMTVRPRTIVATGQPVMVLTGGALERLNAITPKGLAARVLLTMTDEPPYAFAEVMIQAVADPAPA